MILELLDIYGIEVKRTGSVYIGLCPFHDDTKPSFVVYPETDSWYCFSENVGGSAIEFVMRKEGLNRKEAIKRCKELGFDVENSVKKENERIPLLSVAARIIRSFLRKHGLDDNVLRIMKEFDSLVEKNTPPQFCLDFLRQAFEKLLKKEVSDMPRIVRISKKYEKKVSKDWNSWLVGVEITKEYDPGDLDTKEKFIEENRKLFDQVKAIVEADMAKIEELK